MSSVHELSGSLFGYPTIFQQDLFQASKPLLLLGPPSLEVINSNLIAPILALQQVDSC